MTLEDDPLRREPEVSEQTGVSDGAVEYLRRWEAAIASSLETAMQLMLDLAGVGTGCRVLDVAAGAGGQTVLAAKRVGPAGSVLAVDLDGEALTAAAAVARHAGFGNVETRVMDVACIDLSPMRTTLPFRASAWSSSHRLTRRCSVYDGSSSRVEPGRHRLVLGREESASGRAPGHCPPLQGCPAPGVRAGRDVLTWER